MARSAVEDARWQIQLSQPPPTVGFDPQARFPAATRSRSCHRAFAQRSNTESAISGACGQWTRARPTYEVAAMCIEPRLHRARQQLPARLATGTLVDAHAGKRQVPAMAVSGTTGQSKVRIARAGTPATRVAGATSRVTTAPAATTEPSPTVMPPRTVAPAPIQTLAPM